MHLTSFIEVMVILSSGITNAQLPLAKLQLMFCAGSNPARGMSEIHNGE